MGPRFHRQLGITQIDEGELDAALFADFFDVMERTGADYTSTLRKLSKVPATPLDGADSFLRPPAMEAIVQSFVDEV